MPALLLLLILLSYVSYIDIKFLQDLRLLLRLLNLLNDPSPRSGARGNKPWNVQPSNLGGMGCCWRLKVRHQATAQLSNYQIIHCTICLQIRAVIGRTAYYDLSCISLPAR
ncbi:hypothetical protein BDFG_07231 [Blastomyces dermatitidis ATCC 26199]|nr:hypothetical protein BDFG_07231 [Blastomyces dermatitidis ATCC 26199]